MIKYPLSTEGVGGDLRYLDTSCQKITFKNWLQLPTQDSRSKESALNTRWAKNWILDFDFCSLIQIKIRQCSRDGGNVRKHDYIGRFFISSYGRHKVRDQNFHGPNLHQPKADIPAPTQPFQPTGPSPPLISSLCDHPDYQHQHRFCNNHPISARQHRCRNHCNWKQTTTRTQPPAL